MNDQYLAKVIDTIAEHGHMIQGVLGDPTFSYTVGLTALGLPEIWLGGLAPDQAGMVLNAIADHLRTHNEPDAGTPFECGFSVPFMLHGPVDLDAAEANCASYLYNEITVMQVLWPDNAGRFPTDPAYDHDEFAQPVLPLTKEIP